MYIAVNENWSVCHKKSVRRKVTGKGYKLDSDRESRVRMNDQKRE